MMINLSNTLKKKNNKKGFTLIELVVVIAILGILAAIAIPRLTGFQEKAKISSDKATLATLNSAVAVAVANSDITGNYSITVTNGKVVLPTTGQGQNIIESGAAFKLDANYSGTLTWNVSNGAITSAPVIDEANGKITGMTAKP